MSDHGNSDVGEDMYNTGAPSGKAPGLTKEVPKGPQIHGYRKPLADKRLIRYDRLAARGKKPLEWEVTKDDRMSAVDAGDKMTELHHAFGLRGAQPEVLEAFQDAVYFGHTINSGSTLQPGRSKIVLAGNEMEYQTVVDLLGPDLRRFFRAYADEVRENNQRVLNAAKNTHDIVAQEKAAWIREVAFERGLTRHPDLAHDTADACWNLRPHERAALAVSKGTVFSGSVNVADQVHARPSGTRDGAGSIYTTPTARVALAVP